MPKGPLGFPRLTDKGPLVNSVEPTIDIPPSEYNFDVLRSEQPKTAHDTETFMERVLLVRRPDDAMFRYGKYSISNIAVEGAFIPTLSRYVGEDPQSIKGRVMDGNIPDKDISAIAGGFPRDMNRSEAAKKMMRDVERVNSIYNEIDSSGEYWPPTFEMGMSTLDGAHRVAALYHFTGMRNKIYAWELINPDEIGVQ